MGRGREKEKRTRKKWSRGQKRHTNIWHINNFPVTPSPILPARCPDENVYVPWVPHTAHKPLTPDRLVGRRTKLFMFMRLSFPDGQPMDLHSDPCTRTPNCYKNSSLRIRTDFGPSRSPGKKDSFEALHSVFLKLLTSQPRHITSLVAHVCGYPRVALHVSQLISWIL